MVLSSGANNPRTRNKQTGYAGIATDVPYMRIGPKVGREYSGHDGMFSAKNEVITEISVLLAMI
jgi:hypothetical protein